MSESSNNKNILSFIKKELPIDQSTDQTNWKILIVDDEEEVHKMTKLVLKNYSYLGKKIDFFSAYSVSETKNILQRHPDIALILLDVVMEENDSGLKLVHYVRNELGNKAVRVILRTGQPGQAPEEKVILDYDINDYKEKAELTNKKLFTTITTALRNYNDILVIKDNVKILEQFSTRLDEAYERLKMLDEAKMQILRFLSHEINTPLNAIGAAQIFNISTMSEQNKHVLSMVEKGFLRLEGLVRAVIKYFELAGQKLTISPKTLLLKENILEIIDSYSPVLKEKKLSLQFDIEINEIEADAEYFPLVLTILINNAIKFSKSDSVITVASKSLENGKVRISITDQGRGIKEEYIHDIFNAFALGQHERNDAGFGLNLPIAKLFIDAHKGKIWAESEGEGRGSQIIIEL